MGKKDPRIDQYIDNAEDFARPVLLHLREIVHGAVPQVQETLKWGMPYFEYKGNLCYMASFKKHCVFGFWKADLMKDPHNAMEKDKAMGSFGRIESAEDLPSDKVLDTYLKEAAELNEKGVKLPPKSDTKKPEIPDYFMDAVNADEKARQTFGNFSYSHKKEYVEWVTEAKTEATRQKRLNTAIEWMREGKNRNWKYKRK